MEGRDIDRMVAGVSCRETLSAARGSADDPPQLLRHQALCEPCRAEIGEVRRIAAAFRLESEPRLAAAGGAWLARRARQQAIAEASRTQTLALAAALGLVFVAVTLLVAGGGDSPLPRLDVAAPALVLEIQEPSENRLHYVLHGPGGEHRGAFDLGPEYVLETMPAEAVVVDTF